MSTTRRGRIEVAAGAARRQNRGAAAGGALEEPLNRPRQAATLWRRSWGRCQCVNAWRQTIRPEDVLARYGGEEFAVLLMNCSLTAAVAVADKLRRAMPG